MAGKQASYLVMIILGRFVPSIAVLGYLAIAVYLVLPFKRRNAAPPAVSRSRSSRDTGAPYAAAYPTLRRPWRLGRA